MLRPRHCVSAAALAFVLAACGGSGSKETGPPAWTPETRPYLFAATQVAGFLRGTSVDTPHGRVWPDDAAAPAAATPWLSTGAAGTTLFFLKLHQATKDPAWIADVRMGADFLVASIPDSIPADDRFGPEPRTSLYDGWAGVGFALNEVGFALNDSLYQDAARRCARLIETAAARDGDAAWWNDSSDILAGSAGTGLFLLYAANRMGDTDALRLAEAAGRGVLARAVADSLGRLTWTMRLGSPNILPNFSHGAAGIGYFLATLSVESHDDAFLNAALGAGEYLKSIARTDDNTIFLVPYGWPDPAWAGRYDVGWANGPAGTGRLLHRLARITGDPEWSALLAQCPEGIRRSGIPGPPAAGFGDEPFKLDMRFGEAGVTAFLLRIYEETGEEQDVELARRIVDDIVGKGTRDSETLRWTGPRYEFMENPGEPATFTGYFYGAAGYGLLLLQFDAVANGTGWDFAFPDDPFGADLSF